MGLLSFLKRRDPAASIRPHGRVQGDGLVQLSFTLPIPPEEKAREAARQLAIQMHLTDPEVVSMEAFGRGFSTFIVYGKVKAGIDYSKVEVPVQSVPKRSAEKIDHIVRENVGRPLVIVGATLGDDTYAVGIDALLSPTGLAGDRGLEAYTAFRTHHLRGILSAEEIVARAKQVRADVIVVAPRSQDAHHLPSLSEFMAALKADPEFYKRAFSVCVDTQLTAKQALGLGYGAVFPTRTLPSQLANAIAQESLNRAAAAPATRSPIKASA